MTIEKAIHLFQEKYQHLYAYLGDHDGGIIGVGKSIKDLKDPCSDDIIVVYIESDENLIKELPDIFEEFEVKKITTGQILPAGKEGGIWV